MHIRRLQPSDDVEFGMVEEMVAAYWRMHRDWTIESRMIEMQMANSEGDPLSRLAAAFSNLDSLPGFALLHRYETRLHMVYQRALRNLHMLRNLLPMDPAFDDAVNAALPKEPSPIPEHPDPPAPEPSQPEAEAVATPSADAKPVAPAPVAPIPAPPVLPPATLTTRERFKDNFGDFPVMFLPK